jgi:predicted phage terminase large subunit-like protein
VHIVSLLAGFDGVGIPPQGDKITRAKALAAQSLAGNVKLLRGDWNETWLNHMHGQPDLPHDDIMDASSGAFNVLVTIETDWDGAGGAHVEEYQSPWR